MHVAVEVGIPVFSVAALVSCTIYVVVQASSKLLKGSAEEATVNITIMYAFASVNFVIDIVCTLLFQIRQNGSHERLAGDSSHAELNEKTTDHSGTSVRLNSLPSSVTRNLNMLSAFLHVGGDTLRTIAIFSAALVSTITGANPDLCDAWAALAVSVTIVGLAVPMTWEIFKHAASFASDRTVNQLEMISTHAPF